MKSIRILGFCLTALLSTASTVNAQKDFKTDPVTGVQYRFVKRHKEGVKPKEGDLARVVMVYKNEKDSVLFNTHIKGGDSTGTMLRGIPLKKTFNGCLEQGIMMMTQGDSAIFRVNADSLYLKTFHAQPGHLPPGVNPNTFYTFYIKLTKIETEKDVMEAKNKEMIKNQEKLQMQKNKETADIAAYIDRNYPGLKPNADSVYILKEERSKGRQIQEGDSVEMSYIGSLLDGTVFDKSNPNRGSGFKLVYTKNVGLIKGWVDLLPTLHEGDKVKVLIPSAYGYGSRGAGRQIPGYTPLIFDMEVLHVSSNK